MENKESKKFKRNGFYAASEFIENSKKPILVLDGPDNVGKTVIMKQIKEKYGERAIYFNLLENSDEKIDKMLELLKKDKGEICLIDEFEYCQSVERILFNMSDILAEREQIKSKFIFSGSPNVALERWFRKYLGTEAEMLNIPFLQYDEYLYYKKLDNSSESFQSFILNSRTFHGVCSNKEYLECFRLKIEAMERHSTEMIIRLTDYEEETIINDAIEILYAAAFKMHRHTQQKPFFGEYRDIREINAKLGSKYGKEIDKKNATEIYDALLTREYHMFERMPLERFRIALKLLINAGVITLDFNYRWENRNLINTVYDWLWYNFRGDIPHINTTVDFLKRFKLIITHPLFYVNIINDLSARADTYGIEVTPEVFLTNDLLDSILESYIKSVCNYKEDEFYTYSWYTDDFDTVHEIELVRESQHELVEITVSDKELSDTLFRFFHELEGWRCILLGNLYREEKNITRIPYWEYVYNLCLGRPTYFRRFVAHYPYSPCHMALLADEPWMKTNPREKCEDEN